MSERSRLNLTIGDLDTLSRIAAAQRDISAISEALLQSKTSKRRERDDYGRRLNAIKASLHTVELTLTSDLKGDTDGNS